MAFEKVAKRLRTASNIAIVIGLPIIASGMAVSWFYESKIDVMKEIAQQNPQLRMDYSKYETQERYMLGMAGIGAGLIIAGMGSGICSDYLEKHSKKKANALN